MGTRLAAVRALLPNVQEAIASLVAELNSPCHNSRLGLDSAGDVMDDIRSPPAFSSKIINVVNKYLTIRDFLEISHSLECLNDYMARDIYGQ